MTILTIWTLMGIGAMLLIAQDETQPSVYPAYLLQASTLSHLDNATGDRTLVANFASLSSVAATQPDRVDRRLWAADVDPSGRYLYQIEAWGRSTNRRIPGAPTGADFVRIDIATGAREMVLDKTTVFNFVLSPDGQQVVIFYNVGEYLYSRQNACVLNLQTFQCQELAFENVATALWLNEQQFITRIGDVNPLQLVNVDTLVVQPLVFPPEWQVYWGMQKPGTNLLVVSGQPYENALEHPNSFLALNLDDGSVQTLPFKALDAYAVVPELNFSPDGLYLLYGDRSQSALVNFTSGELIQEFTAAYSADWIDDHTLLLQGSRNDGPLEIMRVDASTGQVQTLLSGDDAEGLLLFP
jgi:hypothetical protein